MTGTTDDLDTRVAAERTALLAVLDGLGEREWRTPSLCAGWSVRDLVVHLLMPYELTGPRFLALMLRARFDFDRAADRWARADRRSPEEVVAGLRATEGRRFAVPGAPPEGELSHLVIHAQDVYRPLEVPSPTDPESARIVLGQLTGPRARRALPTGVLDGRTFVATDTDWRHGEGPEVTGPAAALVSVISGRTAALADLGGDGLAALRTQL
ncbi:maleylpyruvate isomerase family mycothiol-dependent enzyme [Blastococcus sp. SYSU D00820]